MQVAEAVLPQRNGTKSCLVRTMRGGVLCLLMRYGERRYQERRCQVLHRARSYWVHDARPDTVTPPLRRDLRGLLKALGDGVRPLLGLAGMKKTKSADEPPVRSLTIDELRPVLQDRYPGQLDSLPEEVRVEQLTKWGCTDRLSPVRNQPSHIWLMTPSQLRY